jgi:hypothetical protein
LHHRRQLALVGGHEVVAQHGGKRRRRGLPAAHGLGHLGLQRFLGDLPDRELDQFAPRVALGHALGQPLTELLACPL